MNGVVSLCRQIFSVREIKKRRCAKNPRLQLVLLQKAEPEGAPERPGHHQPAVSHQRGAFTEAHSRVFTGSTPLRSVFQNPEEEAQQGEDVDSARGSVPEGFHLRSHQ